MFPWDRWGRCLLGGFATGALECRLAPAPGVGPLRSGGLQRWLLLGLKGTMAQAELHFIRARLLGGKLHKAQKGELRFPLCGIVPRRGWPRAPYRFKSFNYNTYKKHEGRGLDYFMVNQESDKDHCREQPSGTKIDLCPDDVAPRITSHFHTGCRLPFRMLRFGV